MREEKPSGHLQDFGGSANVVLGDVVFAVVWEGCYWKVAQAKGSILPAFSKDVGKDHPCFYRRPGC